METRCKFVLAIITVTALGLLWVAYCRADEPRWDDETRLALGQCLVGEAEWLSRTEHAAISHVLKKRWEQVKARRPNYRFISMIQRYCAVHRTEEPSSRQRWIRNLEWMRLGGDPGMRRVRWTNYVGRWDFVRNTVELFEHGKLPDPLPRARHWGGSMDVPRENFYPLTRTVVVKGEHIQLANLFYAVTRSNL